MDTADAPNRVAHSMHPSVTMTKSLVIFSVPLLVWALTLACTSGSKPPPLANIYEEGWDDGISAGHCEVNQEDNCFLAYYRPVIIAGYLDYDREMEDAYDQGFDAAQRRAMECAREHMASVFVENELQRAFMELDHPPDFSAYISCRDGPHSNPYETGT